MEQQYLVMIEEIMRHIAILNDEYGQIQIDVAILKTQMANMVYWGRLGVGALVVMLITQGFQLLQIKKNGK